MTPRERVLAAFAHEEPDGVPRTTPLAHATLQQVHAYPWPDHVCGAGRFELGNAAKGPVQCSSLGLPVAGLIFGDPGADVTNSGAGTQAWQLAVAADPYCGSYSWYDYFQQYAYDHRHRKLLQEWTAFPGTHCCG